MNVAMETTVQQSTVIEWQNPKDLKAHKLNQAIYGDDGYQDLIPSIKELGVLQAIYCLQDNTIISGHRRWQAAIAAGLTSIPTIRVFYPSELDTRRAIIEHNRYRIKNGQQLYNEGKELEAIETEKARQRQVSQLKQGSELPVKENLPERGQTRDIVAQTIGLGSGKQWDKLKYVAEHQPELVSQINATSDKSLTVNAAFVRARRATILGAAKQRIDYAAAHPEEVPVGEVTYGTTPGGFKFKETITGQTGGFPFIRTDSNDPVYDELKATESPLDLKMSLNSIFYQIGSLEKDVKKCLAKYKDVIESSYWVDLNRGIATTPPALTQVLGDIAEITTKFNKQFKEGLEYAMFGGIIDEEGNLITPDKRTEDTERGGRISEAAQLDNLGG